MNNLCYLIKRLSLFPACVIYSSFVALSIFVVFLNLCRIIKLLSSWGFELFFLGIYISLVISQDIPSCETFSRVSNTYDYSVDTVVSAATRPVDLKLTRDNTFKLKFCVSCNAVQYFGCIIIA